MIRRPPRSTQSRSSAASDVYKRQITNRPLAITMPAPTTKPIEGVADQNSQSIPNAQRMAVYSKGPTTDGGARRKASVSQNCPSAPDIPMPASHSQSPGSTERQSPAARIPDPRLTSTRYQNTMDMLELLRPRDRTVKPLSE